MKTILAIVSLFLVICSNKNKEQHYSFFVPELIYGIPAPAAAKEMSACFKEKFCFLNLQEKESFGVLLGELEASTWDRF